MKQTAFLIIGVILLLGVVGELERRYAGEENQVVRVIVPEQKDEGTLLFEKKMNLMRYVLERNPDLTLDEALVIAAAIVDACEKYGLDIAIVAAIIETESGFDYKAVGRQNNKDRGLGQINTKYWLRHLQEKELIKTESDLFEPHINAHATAYIYRYYLDLKGCPYEAIMAYRGGRDEEYLQKVISNI
jgi:soluble lytic murein transglycosylase-like protein